LQVFKRGETVTTEQWKAARLKLWDAANDLAKGAGEAQFDPTPLHATKSPAKARALPGVFVCVRAPVCVGGWVGVGGWLGVWVGVWFVCVCKYSHAYALATERVSALTRAEPQTSLN